MILSEFSVETISYWLTVKPNAYLQCNRGVLLLMVKLVKKKKITDKVYEAGVSMKLAVLLIWAHLKPVSLRNKSRLH